MTIFVHQSEFEQHEQFVISNIHRAVQPDSIELESDLALIAVVGRGMKSTRALPDASSPLWHTPASTSR